MILVLEIAISGQGLHEITTKVQACIATHQIATGLATLFIRHTSASLLIQENADVSVRTDLEKWLDRLVPEGDALYTHNAEGPDDMPAHIKSALTATSLSIPVLEQRLALGTWQGIFLWEHRHFRGRRNLLVHLQEDDPSRQAPSSMPS